MNENLPTSVQLDENQNGSVTFTTEVIATIAGMSAAEVEGVASMYGAAGAGFVDMISRRGQSSNKKSSKGVKADIQGTNVAVHLSIIVDYGSPIPEVAANIQDNVKKAIETMCGLTVTNVDIHVQGLSFEKEETRAAAEIEAQQKLMLKGGEMPHPVVTPADIPDDASAENAASGKTDADANQARVGSQEE